jgi:hypothetical protein
VLLTDSDSGAISLKRELPHTITEWIGTTICVSAQLGLGISPPTHVTAFQPFFLDYTMPYSIKRGEVVQLKVSLFNFLSYNLPVCMWLFRFISSESKIRKMYFQAQKFQNYNCLRYSADTVWQIGANFSEELPAFIVYPEHKD